MSSVNNDDGSDKIIEKPFYHQPEDGVISAKDLKIAFLEFEKNSIQPIKVDTELLKQEVKIIKERVDKILTYLTWGIPGILGVIIGGIWILLEKIAK